MVGKSYRPSKHQPICGFAASFSLMSYPGWTLKCIRYCFFLSMTQCVFFSYKHIYKCGSESMCSVLSLNNAGIIGYLWLLPFCVLSMFHEFAHNSFYYFITKYIFCNIRVCATVFESGISGAV